MVKQQSQYRRNISCVTVAPTTFTVEAIFGSGGGIEPIFEPLLKKGLANGGEIEPVSRILSQPDYQIFDGTQHWQGYNLMLGELD